MTGKIDALAGNVASQDMELLRNGFDPVVFPIKDYGFSIYRVCSDHKHRLGEEGLPRNGAQISPRHCQRLYSVEDKRQTACLMIWSNTDQVKLALMI